MFLNTNSITEGTYNYRTGQTMDFSTNRSQYPTIDRTLNSVQEIAPHFSTSFPFYLSGENEDLAPILFHVTPQSTPFSSRQRTNEEAQILAQKILNPLPKAPITSFSREKPDLFQIAKMQVQRKKNGW